MLTKYSSHDDIVKTWGFEIINTAMIGDYTGDFVAVLYTQGVYGLFVHGYGSCSACDELLGCETDQDMINLARNLQNTIRPYPDFESLKQDSLEKRMEDFGTCMTRASKNFSMKRKASSHVETTRCSTLLF